jgi:TonB family protein
MKKYITFLLFSIALTTFGQDTLSFYYKKNGKETRRINKSEYYRKIIHNNDKYIFQEFLTKSNQLVQESEILSWDPMIENGITTYFDKISKQVIAKGFYLNGFISDKWIYKTENGYDTIYYSTEDINYLSNPNYFQQETYAIVENMPFFDYDKAFKQKRNALDKKIIQFIESGSVQSNHKKYMDIQREIIEINKNSFENYINNNLVHPIRAKRKKIQAIVYVQFVVNEKGNIVETTLLRSVDKDLDKEAVRLVNSMTGWAPGVQKGRNVRVTTTVGVKFEIK